MTAMNVMNVMKRNFCLTLALLLTLSALLCLPACSAKGCGTVDNTTLYTYTAPAQETVMIDGSDWDLYEYAFSCMLEGRCLESIAEYFGSSFVRYQKDEKRYYTVYSLPDNKILYVFLEKKNGHYIVDSLDFASTLEDVIFKGRLPEQDLPSAIIGDRLPAKNTLAYYSEEEIAEKNQQAWEGYEDFIRRVSLSAFTGCDPSGREANALIRCMQSVSFDTVGGEDGYIGYHGRYTYDVYLYDDGTGSLYFYHHRDPGRVEVEVDELLQQESFPLTAEEVASFIRLMEETDFARHPTWNPEELFGMDGSYTRIYATDGQGEHLIGMWEPGEKYPHHHIRTALEDLVRAHVTVEEGRIYRKDLYEEYDWMQ